MSVPFWLLKLLDALLSICVLAPLVVAYWRGTFLLIDILLLPGRREISLIVSAIIGIVGGVLSIYMQNILRDYIHSTESPIAELMLKRIYCYVFGLIVVNHWRVVWVLWDDFTGFGLNSGVLCFTTGMVVLISLRCFRNSIAPPVVAVSDLTDEFFGIATRFRVARSRRILFFLDALFSVAVPGSMIVCVCRGFWYILDNFLIFPVKSHSFFLSAGLGVLLVFMSLLLQRPAAAMSRILEKKHLIWKIIFEDFYMFLATAAGVNIWRGVWGLCNEFIFPNDLTLSSWTCHIVGMGGLMLMFHGSTALIKGFQIDGEFTEGAGCILPASSLTMFEGQMGQTHRKSIAVTAIASEGETLLKTGTREVEMDSMTVTTAPITKAENGTEANLNGRHFDQKDY